MLDAGPTCKCKCKCKCKLRVKNRKIEKGTNKWSPNFYFTCPYNSFIIGNCSGTPTHYCVHHHSLFFHFRSVAIRLNFAFAHTDSKVEFSWTPPCRCQPLGLSTTGHCPFLDRCGYPTLQRQPSVLRRRSKNRPRAHSPTDQVPKRSSPWKIWSRTSWLRRANRDCAHF